MGLAGFLVLLHVIVWVFTLCFSGTCWTTMLHSSESPRKETIAVWISHALFILKIPHGHSGPPRLSSLENDRSGFFMLECLPYRNTKHFHLSKLSHVCFVNKNLLITYNAIPIWCTNGPSWSKLYLKCVAPSTLDWQLHHASPRLEGNTDINNI